VERRSFDHPVLFEALLDTVDEAAGDRVTLWVLEDLHWADEATWEFVRYAARRVAQMGLVLGCEQASPDANMSTRLHIRTHDRRPAVHTPPTRALGTESTSRKGLP